ncbi:MAG: hypothetical protein ACLQGV_05665 [Bryobacteraceae bacterium]
MRLRLGSARLFQVCAAVFLIAALYHLAAVAAPSLGIRGTHWRHVLFVGIDVIFAWLFLRRPWWLALPFALLTLHSLRSHGQGAWNQWQKAGRVDWIGIGVVVVLPLILALLVRDGWQQRKRAE